MALEIDDKIIDEYLLKIQKGDDGVFALLYECTYKQLYALCYSYFRNRFESEDALHDSYIRIKREIEKFYGKNGFNWIFTITKNTCLNIIKKANRIVYMDFADGQIEKTFFDKNSSIKIEDESGIIALSKKVLNEAEFRIVILHAVSGIKFKQIAKIMKRAEATVRWQYNNALKKVLREYEKNN